jgi:tetratricopeptide (TPR) repeat protein
VQRCSALRLAGLASIEAGNLEVAEVHLDGALAALGDEDAPSERCNLYYLYSQLRWHQERFSEAFELAERCLAVAEQTGNVEAIAKGYEMLALACHSLGEWKKGRDFEEQRKEVADGTLDVASAFDVHL